MELQGCHGNQNSQADQGRKYHLALNTKKASTHTGLLSVNSKINSILGYHVSPERAGDGLSFTCCPWSDLGRTPQEIRIHQLSHAESKSLSNPELKMGEKPPSQPQPFPRLCKPDARVKVVPRVGSEEDKGLSKPSAGIVLRKQGVAPTQDHTQVNDKTKSHFQ